MNLHYNGDESGLYVNETEIYMLKVKENISWYNFCFVSASKYFTEICLNGTVDDFSVDHSSIKKVKIHQYLIITNIIKQCLGSLEKYL